MAAIDSLYKFVPAKLGELILTSGQLRWSSPELFDEPWGIKHNPKLGFDHQIITRNMLNTAVSMIFAREMPAGNQQHSLYKAIKRWRTEDRFKDEVEAFDALSELLAQTPVTLETKLKKTVCAWQKLVCNTRILCLSATSKDTQSWKIHADNHRGMALKFSVNEPGGTIKDPNRVEYVSQRCRLTTVKEEVDDLVGIKRTTTLSNLESKLLTKSKSEAFEKEWRCIQVLQEEELDCGEDRVDWYIDKQFQASELRAVYLGFQMPERNRHAIIKLVRARYPAASVFLGAPAEDQYELTFKKVPKS